MGRATKLPAWINRQTRSLTFEEELDAFWERFSYSIARELDRKIMEGLKEVETVSNRKVSNEVRLFQDNPQSRKRV